MKQTIITYPNASLFEKTRDIPLDQINSDTYTQIGSSMVEIMKDRGGVGLSANQVGLPLNMCVIGIHSGDIKIILNPRITKKSPTYEKSLEGCLSLPGAQCTVKRHKWVEVEYETVEGETIQEKFSGFESFVWQHEIDHLTGILMVNRLNDYQKEKVKKQMSLFRRRAH